MLGDAADENPKQFPIVVYFAVYMHSVDGEWLMWYIAGGVLSIDTIEQRRNAISCTVNEDIRYPVR